MKITVLEHFVDVEELHPDNPRDTQSYALHYYEGKNYDVKADKGRDFIHRGLAEPAPKDADLDEPWDTRTATDKDAERYEREVLRPARKKDLVETITPTGRVYQARGDGSDFKELREPQLQTDERHVLLDVHDTESGSGTGF